jgi:hypothetical protein
MASITLNAPTITVSTLPRKVAGDEAEEPADEQGEAIAADRDRHRRPCAVDDLGGHVVAAVVDAEPVTRLRSEVVVDDGVARPLLEARDREEGGDERHEDDEE